MSPADVAPSLTIELLSTLGARGERAEADIAETELAEAWTRLGGGVPFTSLPWYVKWSAVYGRERRLFVLAARDRRRIVAIAPFCVERTSLVGSVLRLLGSGEVCSDQQTLLAERRRCWRNKDAKSKSARLSRIFSRIRQLQRWTRRVRQKTVRSPRCLLGT